MSKQISANFGGGQIAPTAASAKMAALSAGDLTDLQDANASTSLNTTLN